MIARPQLIPTAYGQWLRGTVSGGNITPAEMRCLWCSLGNGLALGVVRRERLEEVGGESWSWQDWWFRRLRV